MKTILLSTTYLGPIQYYSKLVHAEHVIIERFENYPKQTYRNRCIIYSANGPQTLSIPVTKGNELKIHTKDIRIDYSMNWQKIHFKAIESAYRCSPFYQYYIDDFLPFYERKYPFLYDFNKELLLKTLEIIDVNCIIEETTEFCKLVHSDQSDFRDAIHPKKRMFVPDPGFKAPLYQQVFESKLGNIANLSIVDLIFNTGPETYNHLNDSVLK